MAKRKKKRATPSKEKASKKITRPIARKAPPKAKAKPAPKAKAKARKTKATATKSPRKFPGAAAVKRKQPSATPKKSRKRAKPSQTKAAISARKRREAAHAERTRAAREAQNKADARREKRRKQQKKRRKEQRRQRSIGEYALAREWLESIRDRMMDVFDVELAMSEAGGGHADLAIHEGEVDALLADRTAWLIVGRFEPLEAISYAELAAGFQAVADDLILETRINGQRLSQVRVVFHDPNDVRKEGDSVISKIGAWEFVVGDLIGELVGSSIENPTEGSLAARYKETSVPSFYIYFASEIMAPRNVWSGHAGTTTIPWSPKRRD